MEKNIKIILLSLFFSILFMTACEEYPGYDDYVDEQLIAITSYDTKADFKGYHTFSISDTVTIINDDDVEKSLVSSDARLQNLYNQVKTNLTAEGYTFVEGNEADLGVILTLVKATSVYVTSYPYWWYDYCYWYFWDCGYFPYYPYPYPEVVGGYTTGTITIDMFDLKNKTTNKVPAIWTGVVRGLYAGSHTEVEINNAINDCFEQTIPFQK